MRKSTRKSRAYTIKFSKLKIRFLKFFKTIRDYNIYINKK